MIAMFDVLTMDNYPRLAIKLDIEIALQLFQIDNACQAFFIQQSLQLLKTRKINLYAFKFGNACDLVGIDFLHDDNGPSRLPYSGARFIACTCDFDADMLAVGKFHRMRA